LGHICTPLGILPDPKRVRAIEEHPVPKTVREIRAFIVWQVMSDDMFVALLN